MWSEVQAPRYQASRTAWLLTCVDLTSLLVAFFVLLFSMQTMEASKWNAVSGSFQAQFAREVVIPVPVGEGDNGVVRVTGVKSGLAYLDALLHQRVGKSSSWSALQASRAPAESRVEMAYEIPPAVLNAAPAEAKPSWLELGAALRGWKNPLGIRVTVVKADALKGASRAVELANMLSEGGAAAAFAEVRIADKSSVELVVRAR